MLRVVLDTNVLISALIGDGSEYELVKMCLKGEFMLVTSPMMLEEFKEVAVRPRFNAATEELAEFVESLVEIAEVVLPTEKVSFPRDPGDEKILEAAIEGKADHIVSGDNDLLALKSYRGVRIANAAAFLEELAKPRRR